MNDVGYRGRSLAESEVVHAVWDEVGGELVEEFVVSTIAGEPARDRELDGVMAAGSREWHPARTRLSLRGRDVVVCQAKAGLLDFGVLGQTFFGAELLDRQHQPQSVRLIAAAVRGNPVIDDLLVRYRPNGRVVETRAYPHMPSGKSSGAEATAALRQVLVATLHRDEGGLLISHGQRRSVRDFAQVRVGQESLRGLEMTAVILPSRRRDSVSATESVEVDPDEPVDLVYTCSDLYMTAMGRAVFAGEYARSNLGLRNARAFLRYRVDNPGLRELLRPFAHVVLPSRRR
jgi:hypothetical protein